jgi:hypothetical protein
MHRLGIVHRDLKLEYAQRDMRRLFTAEICSSTNIETSRLAILGLQITCHRRRKICCTRRYVQRLIGERLINDSAEVHATPRQNSFSVMATLDRLPIRGKF